MFDGCIFFSMKGIELILIITCTPSLVFFVSVISDDVFCWQRTISAGKLTEKVLKLFLATDCEEIVLLVQLLNIKQPLVPVLPTRCSEKF